MKLMLRITVSVLILLLMTGCASSRNLGARWDEQLQATTSVERLEPFGQREFDPHLDGRWIGQAVAYGCYREGQAPGQSGPSKEQILEDLRIIEQHWNLIRVYNADDDTQRILEVIRENSIPVKVMLGIWLENDTDNPRARESNLTNLRRGVMLTNSFRDIVIAVNVGNETQVFWSWHRMDMTALIEYIRIMRMSVPVPVTTADDYNFWNKPESRILASEVDFIVTHIYPLWNGKTLDESIAWLDQTYIEVQHHHHDKIVVLGEIGWATDYNPEKKGDGEQGTLIKGDVGFQAQERFLLELDAWIDTKRVCTFLFEAFDEPWKGGGSASGPNEIEKNWGVFYENRNPKPSFINYLARKKP